MEIVSLNYCDLYCLGLVGVGEVLVKYVGIVFVWVFLFMNIKIGIINVKLRFFD